MRLSSDGLLQECCDIFILIIFNQNKQFFKAAVREAIGTGSGLF